MLKRWIIIAILFRIIGAWTYSSWFHPDEWYQSLEFAHLLARGFGFYSQEFSLHLRNLLWPVLLTVPLKIIDFFPAAPLQFSIFTLQLFIGLLDLGIFWGFWTLLRPQIPSVQKLPGGRWAIPIILGLFFLPWYTVWDSIRPSTEHLSAVAIWLALGCLQLKRFTWAGFWTVAVLAFRYPSGLFSLGLSLAVLRTPTHRKDFLLGILAGFFILGLPTI